MSLSSADIRAAEWECQKVITRFYRFLDALDYPAVVALMHPEGTWLRKGESLSPDQVLETLTSSPFRTATLVSHHMLSNLVYDVVDADSVKFTGYVLSVRGDTGSEPKGAQPPTHMSTHICRGEARNTPEGWRIFFYTPGPAKLGMDL